MIQRLLTIFIILQLAAVSYAQSAKIDSLKTLLKNAKTTTDQITFYGQLGECEQDLESALNYLNKGLILAKDHSSELESKLYSSFGRVYYNENNADSTIAFIDKKIDLWAKKRDKEKVAKSFITRGKYQKQFLQFDEAVISFEKAHVLFVEINSIPGIIEALNRQGQIHKNIGNYAYALPLYYDSYELARVNGMPKELAAASVNIGIVLKHQENYKAAIDYYLKAKQIYEIEGNDFGLANVYNNIGNVQRLQGDFKGALNNYNLAIELRKKIGDRKRLGYTYNNIALIHTEKEKIDLALEYLKKSEKIKVETEDYETLPATYLNYADIYLKEENEQKFLYYSNLAEQLGKKYMQREVVSKSLINRSEFEANRKDYKKAYMYLSMVHDELDTLGEKEQKILNATLIAHYKNEERKKEISDLSAENTSLQTQKDDLQEDEKRFRRLIIALIILAFILILTSILFFYKQRAFQAKSKELIKSNEKLRMTTISNEEKEVLLKEIHHRVKNNLQIIKSLIRLQNSSIEDDKTNTLLLEFEQRVSSMALVHESLYKSDDLARVNVNNYFSALVTDLIEAYKLRQEVTAELDIEIDGLGIDTLVPLGLLTNEIISNSLKHGFEPNSNGIIKVDLKKIEGNYYQLYIGDNGKGFDFETERSEKDSLGIELIQALVDQLDGEFEFFNENGAYYMIKFKPQEKK